MNLKAGDTVKIKRFDGSTYTERILKIHPKGMIITENKKRFTWDKCCLAYREHGSYNIIVEVLQNE